MRQIKEVMNSGPRDFVKDEQTLVVELLEEYSRRGHFDLLFPRSQNVDTYKKYLKV